VSAIYGIRVRLNGAAVSALERLGRAKPASEPQA